MERITGSDIVYSKHEYKSGVDVSIRSHRHRDNHGRNSGRWERDVREGEENSAEPYLLYTHSLDDPRFKMEYLLLSDSHADLLSTGQGALADEEGRTYVERCPMHNVRLDSLINLLCHSLGDRLEDMLSKV